MTHYVKILLCLLCSISSAFAFNQTEISQIINQKSAQIKNNHITSLLNIKQGSQFNWKTLNDHVATAYFYVEPLKSNPNILFAYKPESYDVVYKSIDNGKQWQALPTPIGKKINHLLSLNDNQLLLSAGNTIYSSSDQGEHWTLLATLKVECKKIFLLNPNVLMLETSESMYRSLDQGKSWSPAMIGLSSMLEYMDGKDNFAIVSASDGLYITRNAGVIWTNPETLKLPVFYRDEAFAINTKNEVFIAAKSLYKTDFNCEKLTVVNNQYRFRAIKVDKMNYLYALVEVDHITDLYKSTDQGKTWTLLYKSTNDNYIMKFDVLSNNSILINTNKGVLLSNTNQGEYNLLTLFTNSSASVNKILVTDEKHIYIINNYFQNNFYQSNDAGKTWNSVNLRSVDGIEKMGEKALMLAWDVNDLKLYTTNDGDNWKSIKTFGQALGNNQLFSGNNSLIVSTYQKGYITHDLINWKSFNQTDIKHAYSDGKYLYINNRSNGNPAIKRSADDGQTWVTLIDNLFFHADAMTGYHDGDNTILLIAFPHAGIIKSTDNGMNWDLINNGLTNYSFTDLIALTKDEYVAATYSGVFHTYDGGNNWLSENVGLTSKEMTSLSANKTALFAGTYGSGIYKTNLQ